MEYNDEKDENLIFCKRIIKLLEYTHVWEHEYIPKIIIFNEDGLTGLCIESKSKDFSSPYRSFRQYMVLEKDDFKYLCKLLRDELEGYLFKIQCFNEKFPFEINNLTQLNMLFDLYGI